MDEQSHKEEMRAALRGDFERLRARLGENGLLSPPAGEPPTAPAAAVTPAAVERAPAPPGRGGWASRLLRRS